MNDLASPITSQLPPRPSLTYLVHDQRGTPFTSLKKSLQDDYFQRALILIFDYPFISAVTHYGFWEAHTRLPIYDLPLFHFFIGFNLSFRSFPMPGYPSRLLYISFGLFCYFDIDTRMGSCGSCLGRQGSRPVSVTIVCLRFLPTAF